MKVQKEQSRFVTIHLFLVWYSAVCALNIDDQCVHADQCPTSAACKSNSCNVNVCLCNDGYVTNQDSTACLELKKADEECSASTQCIRFATCNSGFCKCNSDPQKMDDGRCTDPFDGGVYGSDCGVNVCSRDIPYLDCIQNVCHCKNGYRGATEYELSIQPEVHCYQNGTVLEDCGLFTTTLPTTQDSSTIPGVVSESTVLTSSTLETSSPELSTLSGENTSTTPGFETGNTQPSTETSTGEQFSSTTKTDISSQTITATQSTSSDVTQSGLTVTKSDDRTASQTESSTSVNPQGSADSILSDEITVVIGSVSTLAVVLLGIIVAGICILRRNRRFSGHSEGLRKDHHMQYTQNNHKNHSQRYYDKDWTPPNGYFVYEPRAFQDSRRYTATGIHPLHNPYYHQTV